MDNPFIALNGETINLKPIDPSKNKIKLIVDMNGPSFPPLKTTVSNIANPSFWYGLFNTDFRKNKN